MSAFDSRSDFSRRRLLGAGLGAAAASALPLQAARAQSGEVVVGAAPLPSCSA